MLARLPYRPPWTDPPSHLQAWPRCPTPTALHLAPNRLAAPGPTLVCSTSAARHWMAHSTWAHSLPLAHFLTTALHCPAACPSPTDPASILVVPRSYRFRPAPVLLSHPSCPVPIRSDETPPSRSKWPKRPARNYFCAARWTP